MALLITNRCINCDMCKPECPNEAISIGMETYQIDPDRCTECVGYYESPTCQRVCPIINTIVLDPNKKETQEELQQKAEKLKKRY